jgi:hypothetical protein
MKICIDNENTFKDVKYNPNGILRSLRSEIDLLDGLDFCGWLKNISIDNTGCTMTAYGGYLVIPTTDMVTIVL